MSFLNPIFLLALLTAAIPLLIYLLNIRKPGRIQFSTLAFFDVLKTSALKRIKLKRWLLLTLRVLAIMMLAAALARPFIPPGIGWVSQNQPAIAGLLIDNSPGMDQVDQDGPYFEQAISVARSVVEMGDNETRYVIEVTNGEMLNLPPVSRTAALRHLSSLQTVNAGNHTYERLERLKEDLNREEEVNKMIYLITDAQRTQFGELIRREPPQDPEANIGVQAVKMGNASMTNLGFSTVELEYSSADSETEYQIRPRLNNYGENPVSNAFLTLYVEEEMISQQTVEMSAGEDRDYVFEIPSRDHAFIRVMLEIEGDELSYDNRYYAVLQQPASRKVLVVGESEDATEFTSLLKPLLVAASEETGRFAADFTSPGTLNIAELPEYDAIIFDGLRTVPDYIAQPVIDHVQTGAGLFMLPAADGNMNSYNRFLQQTGAGLYTGLYGSYGSFEPVDRVAEPAPGNPLLDVIFEEEEQEEIRINAPDIFYYYHIEHGSGALPVLTNRSGNTLFAESRLGNGKMVIAALGTDPGWSDFSIKPFFAPFFFRVIDYLMLGEGAQLQTHTLGSEFRLDTENPVHDLILEYGEERIIPQISQGYSGATVTYSGTEWEPGWMTVRERDEAKIFMSGVNQDTMESEVASLSVSEFRSILEKFFKNAVVIEAAGAGVGEQQEFRTVAFGKEIWYWFIITAFILLIAESLVSRHYKAESIG